MELDSATITEMGQLSALTYKEYGTQGLSIGQAIQGNFQIDGDSFSLANSYTIRDYTSTATDMQGLLLEKTTVLAIQQENI
jgi:hypothetical protein